jgi:hypothetical protein
VEFFAFGTGLHNDFPCWAVPYNQAIIYSDPPELGPVFEAMGIDFKTQDVKKFDQPVVDPSYFNL